MKHAPQVKPRGHTSKAWRTSYPSPAPKTPRMLTGKGKGRRKLAKVLPFAPPNA